MGRLGIKKPNSPDMEAFICLGCKQKPIMKPCAVRVALIQRKYSVYKPKFHFSKISLPPVFFFDRLSSSFPVGFILLNSAFSLLRFNRITTYKFVGFLYHSLGLTGSVFLRSGRLSGLISQLQKLRKV